MNYKEISVISNDFNRVIAVRNLELYLSLWLKLTPYDCFPRLNCHTPSFLPQLMRECTGPLRVRDFLEIFSEDEARDILQKLNKKLAPAACVMDFDELYEPYLRLRSLYNLIESFDEAF